MMQVSLLEKVKSISSEMASHNDHIHAQKALELNSKLTEGRLTIALCGHFSAGKSTLVNTLCGAKLLPSSPIPTSANVVTISYNEQSKAEVEVNSNGVTRFAEVEVEQLSQYCIDGESFVSVNIQYPSELLHKGITLLDTPGIDSTDAAHKLATESALHMADVVFYVMDYNHVQSEINFSFAKELKEWGKPLYFIVNQIDKHREQELSFEQYQQSVYDAFHAWHLEPAGILYLSLKDPANPHHQWDLLQTLLDSLVTQQSKLSHYSVWSSMQQLTREHITVVKEQFEDKLQELLQNIGGEEQLAMIENEVIEQERLIQQRNDALEQYPITLRKDIEQLLNNANITPAHLRDLAHSFLDSQKPGFRQGFLFTKGKTQSEQERRLQQFYDEFTKLTDAAIEWHLKVLLREAGKRATIQDSDIEQLIVKIDQHRPVPSLLTERVNYGAVFGNEYTITYCKELSEAVKLSYRGAALGVVDKFYERLKESEYILLAKQRETLRELQDRSSDVITYREIEQQISDYNNMLQQLLLPIITSPQLPDPDQLSAPEQNNHIDQSISFVEQSEQLNLSKMYQEAGEIYSSNSEYRSEAPQKISMQLQEVASLLNQIEGLEQNALDLIVKSERLQKQQFTISLFGAFSAGKSSLANALIGNAVLPVSPNPTTAAINSLLPPQDGFAHNTALITLKTEELMLDDMYYSLTLLGIDVPAKARGDRKQLFKLIDQLLPESILNGGRAHYSYVKAARQGWEAQEEWLGKQRTVDAELYVDYVANESLSCFVSEINYYYDCPLTAAGIVLVDTPGADSVNARHTGVAFNYIKNTDAIIFVTYYNHAFSHADRQFLDQLGRVKDQFELDKMFFIVNAADLASDAEELEHVMRHVESNLSQHGIVNPRMYPISSIQAIEGKLSRNESLVEQSGLAFFEQKFFSFIHEELGTLAIDSARGDLLRNQSLLHGLLSGARSAQTDKEATLSHITKSEQQLLDELQAFGQAQIPKALLQEIEELMYYIIQRLSFRFGDFYQYAFNPSVLREDVGALQQAVWTAWLELQRTLALELDQELLATTLRVEKKMNGLLQQAYDQIALSAEEQLKGYQHQLFDAITALQPQMDISWQYGEMKSKWLWQQFKSPKTFFEGSGKAELRTALEGMLFPSMEQWMKQQQERWFNHYREQWQHSTTTLASRLGQTISQYRIQQEKLLSDESYVMKLENLSNEMYRIIQKN